MEKGVACGGFFLLLLGLTFYILLKDQNPALLWAALGQAKLPWLGGGRGLYGTLFFAARPGISKQGWLCFTPRPLTGPACSMESQGFSSAL